MVKEVNFKYIYKNQIPKSDCRMIACRNFPPAEVNVAEKFIKLSISYVFICH